MPKKLSMNEDLEVKRTLLSVEIEKNERGEEVPRVEVKKADKTKGAKTQEITADIIKEVNGQSSKQKDQKEI